MTAGETPRGDTQFLSWARYPRVQQEVRPVAWCGSLPGAGGASLLPQGRARSYGDVCLNDGGVILSTRRLDRFISFDASTGVLRCEGGVTIDQVLELVVPRGWFVPVTPGTRFVSIGGAIANDVHGKNHHVAGTFGCHVRSFGVRRSTGELLVCSPEANAALFGATIGGLGLTGLIEWAEIQLRPIANPLIGEEIVRFTSLEHFFEVSAASSAGFEYTVAWLDTTASGPRFGRGLFMRGNHASVEAAAGVVVSPPRRWSVPVDAPSWALNRLSVGAFNTAYFLKQRVPVSQRVVHYEPFFYPLDAVQGWNRIYGRRGFLQFQCVVPPDPSFRAIRSVLERVVASRRASFLTVIKEFGERASPGVLSFPRAGVTLCLDFAFSGPAIVDLLHELEDLVMEAGGALYPAKDAVMRPESFRRSFPRWAEFEPQRDPAFSSSFIRRMGL